VKRLANELCPPCSQTERTVGRAGLFAGGRSAKFSRACPRRRISNNSAELRARRCVTFTGTWTATRFISSQSESIAIERRMCVRVSGKQPELWHPDSGKIERAAAWREKDGVTIVLLNFDAVGSAFVVFREAPAGKRPRGRVIRNGKDEALAKYS